MIFNLAEISIRISLSESRYTPRPPCVPLHFQRAHRCPLLASWMPCYVHLGIKQSEQSDREQRQGGELHRHIWLGHTLILIAFQEPEWRTNYYFSHHALRPNLVTEVDLPQRFDTGVPTEFEEWLDRDTLQHWCLGETQPPATSMNP
jgi:hypothetical protein